MRRAQAELARAVGVEQIRLQRALPHHDRAPRGQALAVERPGAQRARDQPVVDDRDVGRRDALAEAIEQERGAPVEAGAADRAGHRAHEGGGGVGIEDHRHLDRLHLARAEPSERAPGGGATDGRRRFQRGAVTGGRVPVIALHLAVLGGDRRHRQAERARRVAAGEAV